MCVATYETLLEMQYFIIFITVLCVIFDMKLRWSKNKSLLLLSYNGSDL